MPEIKIAPSILSADIDNLGKEIKEIEPFSDLIHIDVMDAKFVPSKTFSAEQIKNIRTKVPLDVHLMVEHPMKEGYIRDFADAGASIITIHEECKDDINKSIKAIKARGIKAGISIKPGTGLDKIKPHLDKVDMVLIMSVNPGYSGQKFMPEVLGKVRELRKLKPGLDIEIDGGINTGTINAAAKAGVNIFVAASAVFGKKDRKKAIDDLRRAADG